MRDYVSKNLMKDEKIEFKTKLHWIVYMQAVLILLVGIILIIVAPLFKYASLYEYIDLSGGLNILGIIFVVLSVLYGIYHYLLIRLSEFVVTNKRIILKKGVISIKTIELLLTKAESISIDQNITGRIFGYGTIIVTGSGGTKNKFSVIEKPFEVRKIAQNEIEKTQKKE